MLQLADTLQASRPLAGLWVLVIGLAGGVAMVALGHRIGTALRRRQRRRDR